MYEPGIVVTDVYGHLRVQTKSVFQMARWEKNSASAEERFRDRIEDMRDEWEYDNV